MDPEVRWFGIGGPICKRVFPESYLNEVWHVPAHDMVSVVRLSFRNDSKDTSFETLKYQKETVLTTENCKSLLKNKIGHLNF